MIFTQQEFFYNFEVMFHRCLVFSKSFLNKDMEMNSKFNTVLYFQFKLKSELGIIQSFKKSILG